MRSYIYKAYSYKQKAGFFEKLKENLCVRKVDKMLDELMRTKSIASEDENKEKKKDLRNISQTQFLCLPLTLT